MKKQETINSWQTASLFLAFMTGSAIINIPAPLTGAAKNGAWLSLLIANGIGFLLLACVLYLHRQYPGLTFIDYSRKTLGSWLTVVIAVPFLSTVFLMLSNIVLDIGGFFTSTMMKETPLYVFNSLILMTAALTARAGIEVMARMFTLLLYIMVTLVFAVLLFVLPYYRPEHLLPVFPKGIKPILHGAYMAWGFPYAELILFSMILPFTSKERKSPLVKFMFLAHLVNGVSLVTVIVCTIMAIGPLAGEIKYSVFQLARLINVQEIIERIESVIGFTLIAGSYMKATIVLFILNLALSQLLKLQDDRLLIFPVALVSLLLSLTMFKNEAEFVENVTVVWPLLITTVGVLPVLLITVVTLFKKNRK
ncbi:GerAB/ArcD/ProY family transporter [Effusibacillus consociatus]|uniref:Endospore germination permease n=1 Tax=Effusibacillus consociatus TaxID=1117041 RepID=A0ABV9Q3L6_9BACL